MKQQYIGLTENQSQQLFSMLSCAQNMKCKGLNFTIDDTALVARAVAGCTVAEAFLA